MSNIMYSHTDEKGREFKILGDSQALMQWIVELYYDPEEIDSEVGGTQRQFEDETFRMSLIPVPGEHWKTIFENIPKKKNGTFAKGRVQSLERASSISQLWEDSYGYGAPEIRLKTIDDFTAEIQWGWIVEKWS